MHLSIQKKNKITRYVKKKRIAFEAKNPAVFGSIFS